MNRSLSFWRFLVGVESEELHMVKTRQSGFCFLCLFELFSHCYVGRGLISEICKSND